ncbi:MAG: BNR-4 repeat-containing protein, partial [Bacteroidota bacterium]
MKPGKFLLVFVFIFYGLSTGAQKLIPVDYGWSRNSINTAVFRKNSITSFKNTQFIAFYNAEGMVVLGKRNINSKLWQLKKTKYKGNVADAHNVITIAVDGDGFLHIAWDHHGNKLRYCKSIAPYSLQLTE